LPSFLRHELEHVKKALASLRRALLESRRFDQVGRPLNVLECDAARWIGIAMIGTEADKEEGELRAFFACVGRV